MTNSNMILETMILSNKFTDEQINNHVIGNYPLLTYKEWQKCGYQVKKGEKSVLTCSLWQKKTFTDKKTEKKTEKFIIVKAYLFSIEQVEQITSK